MLYDPKWDQKTKADAFTMEALIGWLETQPPEGRYLFCVWNNCLLAQWLRSIDPEASTADAVTGYEYTVNGRVVSLDYEPFRYTAHGGNTLNLGQQTFGAALERARAMLPQ